MKLFYLIILCYNNFALKLGKGGVKMSDDIKPLKEIPMEKMLEDRTHEYLINGATKTAIKIPEKISKTLIKINSDIVYADILATALNLRAKSDTQKHFEQWRDSAIRTTNYPASEANKAFSKFLRTTLNSSFLKNFFKESEIKELVHFFAKCPDGYSFASKMVMSHAELPVTKI